eukprot:756011-Hanusia_phi.AAC.2
MASFHKLDLVWSQNTPPIANVSVTTPSCPRVFDITSSFQPWDNGQMILILVQPYLALPSMIFPASWRTLTVSP